MKKLQANDPCLKVLEINNISLQVFKEKTKNLFHILWLVKNWIFFFSLSFSSKDSGIQLLAEALKNNTSLKHLYIQVFLFKISFFKFYLSISFLFFFLNKRITASWDHWRWVTSISLSTLRQSHFRSSWNQYRNSLWWRINEAFYCGSRKISTSSP